jgi:putative SOS response-associated peptidase YedK
MCNLYSITTNQAAIIALFRVVNRYVGNLAPMHGVFPDYSAPVVRNTYNGTELAMIRRQRRTNGAENAWRHFDLDRSPDHLLLWEACIPFLSATCHPR